MLEGSGAVQYMYPPRPKPGRDMMIWLRNGASRGKRALSPRQAGASSNGPTTAHPWLSRSRAIAHQSSAIVLGRCADRVGVRVSWERGAMLDLNAQLAREPCHAASRRATRFRCAHLQCAEHGLYNLSPSSPSHDLSSQTGHAPQHNIGG